MVRMDCVTLTGGATEFFWWGLNRRETAKVLFVEMCSIKRGNRGRSDSSVGARKFGQRQHLLMELQQQQRLENLGEIKHAIICGFCVAAPVTSFNDNKQTVHGGMTASEPAGNSSWALQLTSLPSTKAAGGCVCLKDLQAGLDYKITTRLFSLMFAAPDDTTGGDSEQH